MARIDKIILDISGKKVELTEKQAKELKDVLADMFGGKEYVPYPTYPPTRPWDYDHWRRPIWYAGTSSYTICSTTGDNK